MGWGPRVYGLGVILIAVLCLAWGDFASQPMPKHFPDRTLLAYAAGALLLVSGAAVEWRRIAAWGAAALCAYYTIAVLILMNGRLLLSDYGEYGVYESAAEPLAIAAAALIIVASFADIDAALSARLVRAGQIAFGVAAVIFGGAHFAYLNLTAPLVPKWLPPSQNFWAYATGVGHIAAGLAIISRVQARLAAILLTLMYASFTPLVHAPMLFTGHPSHFIWSENALNILLTGAAWVVADSFARARR
jgi:uncharacterized membrane protein YphA (DoxX/SURF4 family)